MVRVSVPHTLIGMECKAIPDFSYTCQKLQHLPRAMDALQIVDVILETQSMCSCRSERRDQGYVCMSRELEQVNRRYGGLTPSGGDEACASRSLHTLRMDEAWHSRTLLRNLSGQAVLTKLVCPIRQLRIDTSSEADMLSSFTGRLHIPGVVKPRYCRCRI